MRLELDAVLIALVRVCVYFALGNRMLCLSHLAKIEAKQIPPWVLAEGVHSAATLTLLTIPITTS
jgi:hypothetical protein